MKEARPLGRVSFYMCARRMWIKLSKGGYTNVFKQEISR